MKLPPKVEPGTIDKGIGPTNPVWIVAFILSLALLLAVIIIVVLYS
ncbi:hypothetical protein LCGC14_1317300 [marine sediment metagenome]|uniref:Uncharacterized protein n=1 Tax=marine sediment metagenome TaxID=412755 RepID=A0A0F9KKK3_9ZZZZ